MNRKICVFGGTSLYRLPLYNCMADKLNCHFFLMQEDSSLGIESYNKEELRNFEGYICKDVVLGNFFWSKNTLRLLKEPYDLYVVGGPYWLTSWVFALLAKIKGKKVATWSHGIYGRETGLRLLIKVCFYRLFNYHFVYNNRAVELLSQNGVSPRKIANVGNSLHFDKDVQVRKICHKTDEIARHFGNQLPTIIFVGRVTKDKRLDLIIKAMGKLRENGIDINLLVVGKDVDNVNLEETAKKLELEHRLWMYGPCYDETQIGNLFYNSTVCVSPGNIGLTAINSLTFGCPAITHDDLNYQGPEAEAIISGVTGDFFKRFDVIDLASVIKQWVSPEAIQNRERIQKACFAEINAHWTINSETRAFEHALLQIFE